MDRSSANSSLRTVSAVMVLALLVGASGCGPGSNIVPVTGVVVYQGKPVADAKVMFMSPESSRTATSQTNAAGEFALTTFTDGDGAAIGEHKVAISAFTDEMVAKLSNAQQMAIGRGEKVEGMSASVPTHYSSFDKSGLTATVKASEKNHFRFELTD